MPTDEEGLKTVRAAAKKVLRAIEKDRPEGL